MSVLKKTRYLRYFSIFRWNLYFSSISNTFRSAGTGSLFFRRPGEGYQTNSRGMIHYHPVPMYDKSVCWSAIFFDNLSIAEQKSAEKYMGVVVKTRIESI